MTTAERLRSHGIRRLGSARSGFRYRPAGGGRLGSAERERVRALAIPPAWRDVWIAPTPRARVQAIGTDAAGRQQYLYSATHARRREVGKRTKVVRFAAALPKLRAAIAAGLQRDDLDRDKVMACILRILGTCYFRPGSQVYAAENGSYGIATIRKRHVRVVRSRVCFDFPAKSGQRQERDLEDRAVAAIVRDLLALPGAEVFKYRNGDGRLVDVKRRDINRYIREIMGAPFSAKDFRTWAGSLHCASALFDAGYDPTDSPTARKRKVTAAIRRTADLLGNTPAVCRASYISPVVLDRFLAGETIRHTARATPRRGLSRAERDLLHLLQPSSSPLDG